MRNYTGQAVLITGGTHGIGLATGLAFGQAGANVYLTHRWGSANEAQIIQQFVDLNCPQPTIVEADVSSDEDTDNLLNLIQSTHGHIEVFISNVSFALVCPRFEELEFKGLKQSLRYSSWPIISYLRAIRKQFGRYPRYTIGMSSRGPDYFLPGYEYVAISKTAMEAWCRHLSNHFVDEDVFINIIRANPVETQSLEATFGPDFAPFCKQYYGDEFFMTPQEVADAALGMCSGLMDSLRGQVLLLDRGISMDDNVVRLFRRRAELGLEFSTKQR